MRIRLGKLILAVPVLFLAVIGMAVLSVVTQPAQAAVCGTGTLTNRNVSHGGVARTYQRYIPQNLGTGAKALVIILHGSGGTGAESADCAASESYINKLADQDKFIVVYPDGIGGAWNTCGPDDGTTDSVDDVGFIQAVIDNVDASYDINLDKVYAIGVSAGGMLASRLGHQIADELAGIGMIVSAERVDTLGECQAPTEPVSVVIMNGDIDTFVPYNGGCVWGDCDNNGAVLSATQTVDYWKSVNGIVAAPQTLNYPNINTADGGTVSRYLYTGGVDNTEVALFRSFGGGHAGPSIEQRCLPKWFCDLIVGPQNWDIEGMRKIYDLLKTEVR